MPHDKKSAAELRAELRALRKEHVKPVSRMRMGDISAEIEKLRHARETVPAVEAVPSAPLKKMKAAATSIKEAKRMEFPVAPADADIKKGPATSKKVEKKVEAPVEKKKISMKDKLAKMLEMISDEESE